MRSAVLFTCQIRRTLDRRAAGLWTEKDARCDRVIARMADLWAVESQVRGYDPQTRLDARRHTSAPIVDELHVHWESELTPISGKSKLAEAI